jgi:phage FluMu protein Com
MNSGWHCEHCDRPVADVSDLAEINERQKCPHCKHHTVVWRMPDALPTQPTEPMTPAMREAAAGNVTPQACRLRKELAAEWFAHMREVVKQTPDQP